MPVEYVRGAGFNPDDDEAEILVKVGWSDQWVQLATVARDPVTHETLKVPGDADSWYVDLDRRGINDLIRELRKARDRAYGRDE